jgi:hypothetical protein
MVQMSNADVEEFIIFRNKEPKLWVAACEDL